MQNADCSDGFVPLFYIAAVLLQAWAAWWCKLGSAAAMSSATQSRAGSFAGSARCSRSSGESTPWCEPRCCAPLVEPRRATCVHDW